jgi:hypothetical protein
MARPVKWLGICGLLAVAAGTIGCASTVWNGYQGGTLKYSEVRYNYTAQPVMKDPSSKTYQLQTDASCSAVTSVPLLDKRGVRRVTNGADAVISVTAGEITHEPGALGLPGAYIPAMISSMPVRIEVKDKSGQLILERDLTHTEYLSINGAKSSKTYDEAKAAMTVISQFGKSNADAKVRQGAPSTIDKNLTLIAKDLFEPRKVSVTLPAVRSAGEVDMEAAYKLLSKAKKEEQVKAALAAYAALGAEHKKANGTDDTVGNYGVLCGLASAKVLSGDLAGSWQETKKAWKLFPAGKEHPLIVQVLLKQQEQAGVEIIPPEEYKELVNLKNYETNEYAKKANEAIDKATNKLMNLFGGSK